MPLSKRWPVSVLPPTTSMPSISRSWAHQHAAGVKGGIKIDKRSAAHAAASRPKSNLLTNAKGNPLTFDVTGGEVHETQGFGALMALHDARRAKLLGDKGSTFAII